MPVEIFYFRDDQGSGAVEEALKSSGPKALARGLAQIDLLEQGEPLPLKLDQPVKPKPAVDKDIARSGDGSPGAQLNGDDQDQHQQMPGASAPEIRSLIVRAGHGHGRVHYYYAPLDERRLVIVDTDNGRKKGRKRLLDKLAGKIDQASAADQSANALKSHREFVAESTLGDPDLAALYARARERSGFALALIRLREAAHHTPESLAERTGLSRALILDVERGHLPKLPALRSLADALDATITISPGSGLTVEPAPRPAAPETEPVSEPKSESVHRAPRRPAKRDAAAKTARVDTSAVKAKPIRSKKESGKPSLPVEQPAEQSDVSADEKRVKRR